VHLVGLLLEDEEENAVMVNALRRRPGAQKSIADGAGDDPGGASVRLARARQLEVVDRQHLAGVD
jgi:hypothetical protein